MTMVIKGGHMKEVPAGEFKAHCLALMDQVQLTGEPIVVTKRGRPVVKLIPAKGKRDSIFGHMAGRAKIVGDIVSPATPLEDWDALK
jgi:prevent-host-death family protein